MAQTDECYYATYCRLETTHGELSVKTGPGSVTIGTELNITREDYVNERGKDCCRGVVTNVRGDVVGYLPATCERRVCDMLSDGWTVRLAPWALMYNKTERKYLIEVGLIAYEEPYAKQLGAFAEGCFGRMSRGERPDIKLGGKTLERALADESYYKKIKTIGYPKTKKDEAFYKTGQTMTETLAAEGSKGNPGCWVGTVFFYVAIIAIVAGIIWYFFLR